MENTQTLDYDNEIEIDLKDLCLELLSFWKAILLALVLGGVIAYAISRFLMVPQYESVAELYVLSKSTSITSLADIQAGTSLTNDYMVVVKGRPVLEQVIVNLRLNETYKTLSDKVELENPTNSRVLRIMVRDENPQMAKKIADEIAKVSAAFIAEKMDQDAPSTIQYGYSDGDPVSPNILKNTVIGALLGMFLAMAVVVIAYLFNDTIMNAEDVEKKLGLNVLGTLPMEDTSEYDGEQRNSKKNKTNKTNKTNKIKQRSQGKAS